MTSERTNTGTTDFSVILTERRNWGLNDYKISELTRIERSKLSKFRIGDRKNPTYDDGFSIMVVYDNERRRKR